MADALLGGANSFDKESKGCCDGHIRIPLFPFWRRWNIRFFFKKLQPAFDWYELSMKPGLDRGHTREMIRKIRR